MLPPIWVAAWASQRRRKGRFRKTSMALPAGAVSTAAEVSNGEVVSIASYALNWPAPFSEVSPLSTFSSDATASLSTGAVSVVVGRWDVVVVAARVVGFWL